MSKASKKHLSDELIRRKREHLELCATDSVAFRSKTNGFEQYDFLHYAPVSFHPSDVDMTAQFLHHTIPYPFFISCMTGGTDDAVNINRQLAEAARELSIPLGLGSLRYALTDAKGKEQGDLVREAAGSVPLLGNIGAAQVSALETEDILRLIDISHSDYFVVHLNPLQELLQPGGEPGFPNFLKQLERLIKKTSIPIIVKEVGSGISREAAKLLLEIGVQGIDTAGAGGTSWAGVEIIRTGGDSDDPYWDWGLPTSYCIRTIRPLKKKYSFCLIGSGGISNGIEMAKAIALGADVTASARSILKALLNGGTKGVIALLNTWFDDLRTILFLTGSQKIQDIQKKKIIRKKNLY